MSETGRERGPARRLAVFAAYGGAAGLGVWLLATWTDQRVRPWLVLALVITAALLLGLVMTVLDAHAPDDAPTGWRADEDVSDSDRFRLELAALARRIGAAMADPSRFELTLRPELARLAVERLRWRHGIDVRSDPVAAHDVLGATLWPLVTAGQRRGIAPTRKELDEWMTAIEAI